tara:strand:+ start:240 stop:1277 length:1038 start_codon:yes stop_codon:yes gene_type:complete
MKKVIKKSNWKHVTFPVPKIKFLDWALNAGGIDIKVEDENFIFESQIELEALRHSIIPSSNGPDTCYVPVNEMKSVFYKSKERAEKIKLLNGDLYNKDELLNRMFDDSFYYGELGKNALSSSAIKQLIDSPKSYARSLNFKSDSNVFKTGRLIHLAALEPEKLNSLCHIVEVQSAVTKKYKDKVQEIGSSDFVYTRKEWDKAMYTVDALMQNQVWQEITRNALFERPAFDILHGLPFRAKADILGEGYLADLKTTSDLKAFPWSAKKYGYDVQVYIYCNLFNIDFKNFNFFVIDKSSGDLGIYDVSESFYLSGKSKLEYGIKIYETYFVTQEEKLNEYIIRGTLE